MTEKSNEMISNLINECLESGDLKPIKVKKVKKVKSNRKTYRRKQWRKKK